MKMMQVISPNLLFSWVEGQHNIQSQSRASKEIRMFVPFSCLCQVFDYRNIQGHWKNFYQQMHINLLREMSRFYSSMKPNEFTGVTWNLSNDVSSSSSVFNSSQFLGNKNTKQWKQACGENITFLLLLRTKWCACWAAWQKSKEVSMLRHMFFEKPD